MWVADGIANVLAYDAVASIEPDLAMVRIFKIIIMNKISFFCVKRN